MLGAEQLGMIYCGKQQGMKFTTVWQVEIGKPLQSRNAKTWFLMIIITYLQLYSDNDENSMIIASQFFKQLFSFYKTFCLHSLM